MNNRPKLLIIDDDSRNIFALAAVLESKGFTCCSADSALMGITLLRRDSTISVVLMDMMMPEMDGYEAIAEIGAIDELKHIPIIAVTAQAMHGDKEKCLNAGASAYISKPIDIDVLVHAIKNLNL